MWLFIDKKFICYSNGFLISKIWIGHRIKTSQNKTFYIDSCSKFVNGI
jgi:hypothetical protein